MEKFLGILEHLREQSKFILPNEMSVQQKKEADFRLLAHKSYIGLKTIFNEFLILGFDGLQTNGGGLNAQNIENYIQYIKSYGAEKILFDILLDLVTDLFLYTEPEGEEILFRQNLQFSKAISFFEKNIEKPVIYNLEEQIIPPKVITEEDFSLQYTTHREYLFWQFFKLITHCFNETECLLVGSFMMNVMRSRYNQYKLEELWDVQLLRTSKDFKDDLLAVQEKLKKCNDDLVQAIQLYVEEKQKNDTQQKKTPELSLRIISTYYQRMPKESIYNQRFNAFTEGFFKLHQLNSEKMF